MRKGRRQTVHDGRYLSRRGPLHHADHALPIPRTVHRLLAAGQALAAEQRRGLPLPLEFALQGLLQRLPFAGDIQVDAPGVAPRRAEQLRRRHDARVGAVGVLAQALQWMLDQRRHRHPRVDQLVHERGVGAVLQQAPYQIRQQIAMRADRRVDAHGAVMLRQHRVVQRIAHAVQALELEFARLLRLRRQGQDAGHRVRVVAGELRVEHPAGVFAEQVAGAGQVGGVGAFLAGEHRVAAQAALLAVLDLAVPVGALDQAQRDAHAQLAAEQGQPHQHRQAALGIGLYHQTESVPATQLRVAQQLVEQFQ
ncbi:hypothetical protein D3C78_1014070 [compost metagenome]